MPIISDQVPQPKKARPALILVTLGITLLLVAVALFIVYRVRAVGVFFGGVDPDYDPLPTVTLYIAAVVAAAGIGSFAIGIAELWSRLRRWVRETDWRTLYTRSS